MLAIRSARRRAASNTLTVPTTLTCAPSGGSARQNGTCSAARWITFVIPCSSSAHCTESSSLMSPWICTTFSSCSSDMSSRRRPRILARIEGDHVLSARGQQLHGPCPDTSVGTCHQVAAGGGFAHQPDDIFATPSGVALPRGICLSTRRTHGRASAVTTKEPRVARRETVSPYHYRGRVHRGGCTSAGGRGGARAATA